MWWLLYSAMFCGSLALLLLYRNQDSLLYYPDQPPGMRKNIIPASEFGLDRYLEEVFFETVDKVKLWAYLVRRPYSKEAPTILFFHGNAGNISHRLPNVRQLWDKVQCNVFIVEYRGYGKSEGAPSEAGLKLDAQAALEYLLKRDDIDPKKIILFGRSLGGAVAAHVCLKNEDKVKALIIENTFTSVPEMVSVVFPVLSYAKALSTNKWDTKEIIPHISVPILFLTGEKDELVPASHMTDLYNAATSSKRRKMCSFSDGSHMNTWTQPQYYENFKNFVDNLF